MNLCKQMPAELVRERLQVLTQQRALHTRGPAYGTRGILGGPD